MASREGRWAGLLAVGLLGCGMAQPKTGASEPPPRTIEEAEQQLTQNEARLGQSLGLPPPDLSKKAEAPAPAPSTSTAAPNALPTTPPLATNQPSSPPERPPPPSPPKQGSTSETLSDGSRKELDGSSPCAEVCRALASMQRAADTICRLTSPDDERCQGARRRVQASEERASPCGCRR